MTSSRCFDYVSISTKPVLSKFDCPIFFYRKKNDDDVIFPVSILVSNFACFGREAKPSLLSDEWVSTTALIVTNLNVQSGVFQNIFQTFQGAQSDSLYHNDFSIETILRSQRDIDRSTLLTFIFFAVVLAKWVQAKHTAFLSK